MVVSWVKILKKLVFISLYLMLLWCGWERTVPVPAEGTESSRCSAGTASPGPLYLLPLEAAITKNIF